MTLPTLMELKGNFEKEIEEIEKEKENTIITLSQKIDDENSKVSKMPKEDTNNSNDGNVAIIRDFKGIIPLSYSQDHGRTWKDDLFNEEETMRLLKYGHGKVTRLFNELSQANLIYRKSCGPGKAKIIYMIKSSDLFD